jgi:alpha/beta superfamily hydrolase
MLNKVVFHLARGLHHDLGLASLRFNFRGVGRSEGAYEEGRGEVEDVLAAWREARRRVGDGPLVGAGFSFGAAMSLLAAARSDLPDVLALAGIPLRIFTPPATLSRPLPLAAVHGELDQFTPPGTVERYLERWPGRHALHVVEGADHFLEGRMDEAVSFLSRTLRGWGYPEPA